MLCWQKETKHKGRNLKMYKIIIIIIMDRLRSKISHTDGHLLLETSKTLRILLPWHFWISTKRHKRSPVDAKHLQLSDCCVAIVNFYFLLTHAAIRKLCQWMWPKIKLSLGFYPPLPHPSTTISTPPFFFLSLPLRNIQQNMQALH